MRGALIAASALAFVACGGSTVVPLECPAGQALYEGVCQDFVTCGPGTHPEGRRCVANATGLGCGSGTIEQGGVCVAELECGRGTRQEGDTCVVAGSTVVCGEGTTQIEDVCVADAIVMCGPGTVLIGDTCVTDGTTPEAFYEVRIGATELPGDGFTTAPVLVLARGADGAPSRETVVLTLERPGAGSLEETTIALAELGSITYFRTCSTAQSPSCAGTQKIRVARASDPSNLLGESQAFELIEPQGVGSTAPCDSYANALHFDGMGYIFTGIQTVTQGSFVPSSSGTPIEYVEIRVSPTASGQGSNWRAAFKAPDDLPLQEQVYPMANRYPFEPPGVAGLSVTGSGRGCNRSSGSFQIHTLTSTNASVDVFVATFEQFCEENMSNWLRGCVKFTR